MPHHLIDRVQSIDVQEIPPPVVRAVLVIGGGRLEHRVRVEPLHRDRRHPEHVHVRRRKPAKPVGQKAEELEEAGDEAARALGQPIEIAHGVGSKVQETDEQAAHEEERVDAEGAVLDGLEEELLFDDLAVLHVVRVLEDDDARVAEDDPGHGEGAQAVDRADGVAADLRVADHPEVRLDGERQQELLPDVWWWSEVFSFGM